MPAINATSVIEFLATQPDGATSKVIAKHFGVTSKLLNRGYTTDHAELFDPSWVGMYKLNGIETRDYVHYLPVVEPEPIVEPAKPKITLKVKPKAVEPVHLFPQ